MPLCQVNIVNGELQHPAETMATLRAACRDLACGAPVIVLVHGFKYSPWVAAHDPHSQILSLEPRRSRRSVSWPRRLGLGAGTRSEPLCIALGWDARGTLWQAYERADATGVGLADVIGLVGQLHPSAPVQVLAHSLGARVALAALPCLPEGRLTRMVLLAAAETRRRAEAYLDCPAGRGVEVLNVTSRENAVFDRLIEWLLAPRQRGDRALGAGLGRMAPRWIDLWVDDPASRASLSGLGYRVPAPDRRICHWSVYLRSGLFDLYRDVLTEGMNWADLRAAVPEHKAPRATLTIPLPSLPLSTPRRGAS